jgi:hypothetical protein
MTDINKALAFAKECLGWKKPVLHGIRVIDDIDIPYPNFDPDSAYEIQSVLDTFLAKRYLIQINRGTSTLFKWTVIVALQNLTAEDSHSNQACADSDDLFDAIFDACVMAVRMDK